MALLQEQGTLLMEDLKIEGYERLVKITDDRVGLKALICIHSLNLGPALGGTRMFPYATFEEGLTDVKRLAKGMTYKSALSGVGTGGGKSVIFGHPGRDKTEALLQSFAKAVHLLNGDYICAEDSGTTTEDMTIINKTTPYVVGLPHEKSSGNPSPFTAWGTLRAIQAVLKKVYGNDSLADRVIAIQGVGSVGTSLAELLFWHGAKLILSDINQSKASALAKQFGGQAVSTTEILTVECDVLSPCAMGGIINSDIIPKLRCKGIAGCANNQLWKDSDADELMRRGIIYAPDYVANSGGLINVCCEIEPAGYNPSVARSRVHQIYDQLGLIFEIADQNHYSTQQAANALGDYRLAYGIGRRQEPIYFHHSNHVLKFHEKLAVAPSA